MDFEPPSTPIPGSPEDPFAPEFNLEGTEPAWERKAELGFFSAFLETTQQVLLRPQETFERLFVGGGFMTPTLYAIIGGTIAAIANGIYNLLLNLVMGGMGATASGSSSAYMLGQGVGGVVGLILVVFLAPILVLLVTFIGAGIYHLMLMMLGVKGDFEVTYRVHTYAYGASVLLGLVPFCGTYIGIIWGMVAAIIGLSKAHKIETWKGAVAVIVPFVVCCGLILVLYFAVFATIFAGLAGAAGTSYTP